MNSVNFLFYQIEMIQESKSQVSFYLPEPDMSDLKIYLDNEFIYLAQNYYRHPEVDIKIFLSGSYVLLILGEKNESL